MRIAEVVTGTLITDSPNRGTLPLSSLTPVAKVLPCTSILSDTPSYSIGASFRF